MTKTILENLIYIVAFVFVVITGGLVLQHWAYMVGKGFMQAKLEYSRKYFADLSRGITTKEKV